MLKYFNKRESSPPKRYDPPKQRCSEFNVNDLEADPGKRKKLTSYHPKDIENVRRAYLLKGPCQPKLTNYPSTLFGTKNRKFNPSWYSNHSGWLEYSVEKDALFCLYCYLFKPDNGGQSGGGKFVGERFNNWKNKGALKEHEGGVNSTHKKGRNKCTDLLNQDQHIDTLLVKQSDQARIDYRIRLTASVDCIRFILKQGLPFRGNDESEDSENLGNFLELLEFLTNHNDEVAVVTLRNAHGI